MKPDQLRIHIRQLCCLGLPAEQLMPALLKAVRRLVGAESAAFFWVDSRGEMTGLYAERLLPAPVMKLYFERYYESGAASFKRAFAERASTGESVIAVSTSPSEEATPIYNEVYRHLEAHHILYGIVREQGQALGQLSLYRPKSASAFTAAQRTELATIMRYVAHGVSHRGAPAVGAVEYVNADEDAVFVIGPDGEIRQIAAAAQKLLALATQGGIGPEQMLTHLRESARPALRQLAGRLRDALGSGVADAPDLVIDNAWGRFVLRAYAVSDAPLDDASMIAVRIQRQEPMLLRFVDALEGLGLSPQQREIAAGLAKGMSNQELAEAMGISANTIAYHIKQLFQRLDTHDRQQMVGRVLGSPGPRGE